MKQRVAVALATVWLASIVGASVPSGETTAFSTHHPPGPSPDQYTPLLRKPHYYSQDDYGQDWMNDEPSRIKVRENMQGQTPLTNSDGSLPVQSAPNEFYKRKTVKGGDDIATPYRFQSKDIKMLSELDREAMRLSSIKVAFDEPIDSEISENTSEEDWINDGIEDEDVMQQDEFVSDGTFEDEGPGSVEVYKLDLYKDRSILSPKPSRKNWVKNKSKIPKKVEAVDQIVWKTKDQEESKQRLPKIVPRPDSHSDEFSPSRSFKDRIFGVGGVPELQVGCEGVEGSQRQKRSDSKIPARRISDQSDAVHDGSSARATTLYIDADDDEDEDEDTLGGTDELLRILSQATTTTDSPSNENRGDMDPRVKTPGDLDRPKKKDKLPTRGDLGPAGDPNLTDTTEAARVETGSTENKSQLNHSRKLLSLEEEELAAHFTNMGWYGGKGGYWHAGHDVIIGSGGRRRGHRRHRDVNRRRRHEGRQEHEREENEIRKRSEGIDRNREDYQRKKAEEDIRENRVGSAGRKIQPSNLSHQLPTRKEGRGEDYSRRYEKQIEAEKRGENERRRAHENERRLENYRRRNTPIPRRLRTEDNQRGTQQQQKHQQQTNQLRTTNSKNQQPQNIRLPIPPVHGNRRNDRYADDLNRLQEQRQREVGHINRATHEQELRQRQKEQRRQSMERSPDHRQGKSVYKQRSQQEIDRLNALPVSAYIIINQQRPEPKPEQKPEQNLKNGGPDIENRFGSGDEITFPGLNPGSSGREVPEFPAPATSSPPVAGPSPCTWAIMTCCSNRNRLASCFEAKGCYQGHWDDPCSQDKMLAALRMVNKYYGG